MPKPLKRPKKRNYANHRIPTAPGSDAQVAGGLQKEGEVVKLRAAGLSFEQIATHLGYANKGGAYKAYQRGMSKLRDETEDMAGRHRQLELVRTDQLIRVLTPLALGRPARTVRGPNGQPIVEPERLPDLKAIDRLHRLMEFRTNLLGLAAPRGTAAPSRTPEEEAQSIKDSLDQLVASVPKPNGHDPDYE